VQLTLRPHTAVPGTSRATFQRSLRDGEKDAEISTWPTTWRASAVDALTDAIAAFKASEV